MSNTFSLPGIKSLSYINAAQLPDDLAAHALSGAPIWLTQSMVMIPFTGEASCVCTRTNEHGAPNESVEMSFQSLLSLPEHIPLAFVVTDVNNRSFLIGAKEQPWPYVESSQGFGLPDGESSTTTYTITHKAPKALIPCTCAG